jgi:hypothetical protein
MVKRGGNRFWGITEGIMEVEVEVEMKGQGSAAAGGGEGGGERGWQIEVVRRTWMEMENGE